MRLLPKGCGLAALLLLIVAVGVPLAVWRSQQPDDAAAPTGPGPSAPAEKPDQRPAPAETAPAYRVAKRWRTPNGGESQVIVISPDDATDAGLRALGEKLRTDTRETRHAFVFIFDDAKAAAMYGKVNFLTRPDQKFYDKHFVGAYNRNATTGFHQLNSHPEGLDGPMQQIKY